MTIVFISDAGTGTVGYRCVDSSGAQVVRQFWVPASGGHVLETSIVRDDSSSPQVCKNLSHRGWTLQSSRADLLSLIQREVKAVKQLEYRRVNA